MKACLALLLLVAAASTGSSQGYVTFLNNVAFWTPDPTGGNRLVFLDAVGGTKLTGTQYVAELYLGANADSLQPLPTAIAHFRPPTTLQPGTWNYPPGGVTLPGFDCFSVVTLQVRVWDITQFATYEQALGQGITGSSDPFTYIPNPYQPPCSQCMEGLRAFALVPEPTVFVLSFIGLASFLILRKTQIL